MWRQEEDHSHTANTKSARAAGLLQTLSKKRISSCHFLPLDVLRGSPPNGPPTWTKATHTHTPLTLVPSRPQLPVVPQSVFPQELRGRKDGQ